MMDLAQSLSVANEPKWHACTRCKAHKVKCEYLAGLKHCKRCIDLNLEECEESSGRAKSVISDRSTRSKAQDRIDKDNGSKFDKAGEFGIFPSPCKVLIHLKVKP